MLASYNTETHSVGGNIYLRRRDIVPMYIDRGQGSEEKESPSLHAL